MKVSRDGRPGDEEDAVSRTGVAGGDGMDGMVVLHAMTDVARSARKSGESEAVPSGKRRVTYRLVPARRRSG